MTSPTAEAAPQLESTPWAPLRHRAFAGLWFGSLFSGMAMWIQTVGAQWLLVDAPNAATVVALVQAAMALPMLLLALPAGVLADTFDRRLLLVAVQGYFLLISVALAVLTFLGMVPPAVMLGFTFLLGVGGAVQLPAWQACTPELVDRHEIRSAARLEMVGINLSRAIGPALGGLIIARFSIAAAFAVTAALMIPQGIALLLWRRQPTVTTGERERFWPALRAGARYVWHDTPVRRVMARLAAFIFPASALWGLLPLVASRQLDVDAGGYGIMFAALGVGAIIGALILGKVRTRLSTNLTLAAASLIMAAALALLVLVTAFPLALVILVFAGLAWTATISTLVAELQLFLPTWVMARGMAVYVMVFTGTQAIASLIWGLIADQIGLTPTFLTAGALGLLITLIGLGWRVADASGHDPDPVVYWTEARVGFEPDPRSGPVQVMVRYTIAEDQEPDWFAAMQHLRKSRLRTGATRWELYRDAEHRHQFVEQFCVPTWEEHQRQHDGRLTITEQHIEEAALSYSNPPATADHLLPPG